MPRTRKPPADDPGPFARALLNARHKAGKNTAVCAKECGLSRTFLTMIEIGKRCPELERVPAIALAYDANVAELCWTWVTQWAPAAVRYLAISIDLEHNPVIVDYFQRRWANQQAEKAERAAAQAARVQEILDKPLPVVEPFEHHGGYRQVGELDPATSLLNPRGGVAEPRPGKKST